MAGRVCKTCTTTCMLWHHRLGHIGEKGFKTILNEKLVDNISNCFVGKTYFCEHCVFGK